MTSVSVSLSLFRLRGFSIYFPIIRNFCQGGFNGGHSDDDFDFVEEPLKRTSTNSDSDSILNENVDFDEYQVPGQERYSLRRSFIENSRIDAKRVLQILRQHGPGFNTKLAMNELDIRVSGLLVREVLFGILKGINVTSDKTRCARLGYIFFTWSGQQEDYEHTPNSYHLLMKIYADCDEIPEMWLLVDDMIKKGFPITARTFNILISASVKAGLGKKVVEGFIKSTTFEYRPFKHSFNAVLHGLLVVKQYKLIEWVYEKMLAEKHTPDTLTYNIVMYAKCRLKKFDQFYTLGDQMVKEGNSEDLHTYNISFHVLGKKNKPVDAQKLLSYMKSKDHNPSVLHFTTLIDGFSRARHMETCEFFFNEMRKFNCFPDVVCYTVMITGYIAAGELEKAQNMLDEMITKGQLPNVFTYNAMIRGFCGVGKFQEAGSVLKGMVSRGCYPNSLVYGTLERLERKFQRGRKLYEANEVRRLMEKVQLIYQVPLFKGYRRC